MSKDYKLLRKGAYFYAHMTADQLGNQKSIEDLCASLRIPLGFAKYPSGVKVYRVKRKHYKKFWPAPDDGRPVPYMLPHPTIKEGWPLCIIRAVHTHVTEYQKVSGREVPKKKPIEARRRVRR